MPNASHQKSLNEYQTALQWMHAGKYDKARQVFEKLSQDGPVEILERARMYLTACKRRGPSEFLFEIGQLSRGLLQSLPLAESLMPGTA